MNLTVSGQGQRPLVMHGEDSELSGGYQNQKKVVQDRASALTNKTSKCEQSIFQCRDSEDLRLEEKNKIIMIQDSLDYNGALLYESQYPSSVKLRKASGQVPN